MIRLLLVIALALPIAALAQDRTAEDITTLDTDDPGQFAFLDALGLYEMVVIISDQSIAEADTLRQEFLPAYSAEAWRDDITAFYAPEALALVFEAAWTAQDFDRAAQERLMLFYQSELGLRIIADEIDARRTLADPDGEAASYIALDVARVARDARLDRHAAFAADNGMVARNVTATLNGQIGFFRGLNDGGGLPRPLPEEDLLQILAGQEPLIRAETEEWLAVFQLLAYGPLSDAEFAMYRDMLASDDGRALNAALFETFDRMMGDLQYRLGLLVAARSGVGDL